jgi:hypothetical protein
MIRIYFLVLLFLCLQSYGQDLKYYLPDSVSYDPAVPKPKDVIHHEVGEYHVTHDRLVNYMHALAKAVPSRIKLETMGYSYEGRPQVLLLITSSKNHQDLEKIRQQHLLLSDPARSSSVDISNMPVVVYIGSSIHGNEASGSNAALVGAYHLAAAQGKQMDELLNNTVILFDPSFNPDGLQRFSTWVNQHKGKAQVSDNNSREFNEVWPGGRFNHYWFDLNRDWLPAQHVESRNRLKWFHQWKPNILTDHHEQGSNATFFFQPGVPSRVNPLTPAKNQELTAKLGNFHAAYLDRIGSLYFTKENYDDFYYGKGSTYPDINGAIGILFEQASSRGHAQQTSNGLLTFPFTIRNQFVTMLSTLEGARVLRKDFLQWQKDFYTTAINEASSFPVKAYVVGDDNDPERVRIFVNMLLQHQIDIYALGSDMRAGSNQFKKGNSFVIPAQQPQFRLLRAIFEKTLEYKDSLFYDITSWTLPLAFGLPYAELDATQYSSRSHGEKITEVLKGSGRIEGGRSGYGYLMEWKDFYAAGVLFELQKAGIFTKVATNPFVMQVNGRNRSYGYGTIWIPVSMQEKSADEIYSLLNKLVQKHSIVVDAVQSGGAMSGSDLGSSRFVSLTKPDIAMVVGTGVNALSAGEIWHLLDQRFEIPVSHLESSVFNRVDLSKYNTIILAAGSYNDLNKEKLRTWVQGGGTLILTEEAVSWAAQNGISTINFKRGRLADSTQKGSYVDREQREGAQRMNGSIFKAEVDLSHPLAYGYQSAQVNLFKDNSVFMEKSKNPYATPFYYKDQPLQSGWLSRQNLEAMKNSAAVIVNTVGSGRIISIADNPNLRGFWLGGSRLMMNSIFFGRIIDAASARTE